MSCVEGNLADAERAHPSPGADVSDASRTSRSSASRMRVWPSSGLITITNGEAGNGVIHFRGLEPRVVVQFLGFESVERRVSPVATLIIMSTVSLGNSYHASAPSGGDHRSRFLAAIQ